MKLNNLTWLQSGILLGITFFIAIFLIKPIGVSTQFVIFDGIIWNNLATSVIEQENNLHSNYAYIQKYAKKIVNPINYDLIFVVFIFVGGFLSSNLTGYKAHKINRNMPTVWRNNFGNNKLKRYFFSFIGGLLALYGARLADGCTSGHMMSGITQTALSGYMFAISVFILAIPIAILMYKK